MAERLPQGVVDFATLNPGILDLYRLADVATEGLSTSKGCAHECSQDQARPYCCRDKTVSQQEFDIIAAAVPTDELYKAANAHMMGAKSAGWCPFLTDAGECGVHEWRPIECRVIGTIEPAPSSCKPTEKVTQAMYDRRVAIRESLYRIRAALVGNGPRRPLSEWLIEYRLQRDARAAAQSMPK